MRFLLLRTGPALLFTVSDIANVLKKCTQVGTRRSLRLRGRATWRWRTSRRPSCRATMKWSMWARQLGSGMLKPPIPAAESFNLIRPCRFFICMQVRVQLPGKATQKIFDEALTFLARDAPPVPGFRKSKGGTEAPHNLSSYDGILAWHLRSCFLTRINYICFHEVIQTSDIFSASSAWTFRENIKCKCLQTSVFPVRHPFNCTVFPFVSRMHSLEDPKCKTIKERFINLQNMRCSLRYPILFFWNKSAHYCLNQLLNQTRIQAAIGN